MKYLIKILILSFCVTFFTLGCAERIPKPERAQKIMSHYYKKYGKKYPKSPFGHADVDSIEVSEIEEIHKDLVYANAFVFLKDKTALKVRFTLIKKAFGWRAQSWENLSGQKE